MRKRAISMLDDFVQLGRDQDSVAFWKDRFPREQDEQSELAGAFEKMGVEHFNRGDAQAALDAFWPNFLPRLEIVSRQPTDRGAIRDFASAEDLIGLACIALGNLATADEMLSEALN